MGAPTTGTHEVGELATDELGHPAGGRGVLLQLERRVEVAERKRTHDERDAREGRVRIRDRGVDAGILRAVGFTRFAACRHP